MATGAELIALAKAGDALVNAGKPAWTAIRGNRIVVDASRNVASALPPDAAWEGVGEGSPESGFVQLRYIRSKYLIPRVVSVRLYHIWDHHVPVEGKGEYITNAMVYANGKGRLGDDVTVLVSVGQPYRSGRLGPAETIAALPFVVNIDHSESAIYKFTVLGNGLYAMNRTSDASEHIKIEAKKNKKKKR